MSAKRSSLYLPGNVRERLARWLKDEKPKYSSEEAVIQDIVTDAVYRRYPVAPGETKI